MPENEEVGDSFHEESNLIYCYVEDLLYMNIWEWLQKGQGQSVHDYVKERPSDSTYQVCETMLDKILDITGYLCGHRIGSLLQKNRLKSVYKWVFVAYHSNSRLENGHIDLLQGLPAELSLFREHSGGLYYAKKHNFDFKIVIHAIWIQQCFTAKSDGRPFVFVFDQVDSVPYGEDMKRFIMSVAEESYLTRRYVVLILTADAVNAKTMWEWNGHEKIVLMSDIRRQSPMNYRWDQLSNL